MTDTQTATPTLSTDGNRFARCARCSNPADAGQKPVSELVLASLGWECDACGTSFEMQPAHRLIVTQQAIADLRHSEIEAFAKVARLFADRALADEEVALDLDRPLKAKHAREQANALNRAIDLIRFNVEGVRTVDKTPAAQGKVEGFFSGLDAARGAIRAAAEVVAQKLGK